MFTLTTEASSLVQKSIKMFDSTGSDCQKLGRCSIFMALGGPYMTNEISFLLSVNNQLCGTGKPFYD